MTSPSILSSTIASVVAAMAIINPAYAESADGSGGFASLIPLILIMVIFYFLLIRPQQKKLKEHRNLVDELKKGDKVLTSGGLYGKVIDVKDDVLKVEIAEGVRVNVKRDTVAGLADIAPTKEKTSGVKPAKKGKSTKTKAPEEKASEAASTETTTSETTNTQDKA